jgi:hypothetical protein
MEGTMSNTHEPDFVFRLTSEIEDAWNERRDHAVVDRLAAEHPELAEELYQFFADVVEAAFGNRTGNADPALQLADERMRSWLEGEGFRRLAQAARSSAASSTSPDTTTAPAMSFLAYLRKATGSDLTRIASALSISPAFLVGTSDHPEVIPDGARRELVRRVRTQFGLEENAILASLDYRPSPLRQAASRPRVQETPQISYPGLVQNSGLSPADEEFWLSLSTP